MSTLDGNSLFASGPHSIQPGSWERRLMRRGFAGINGELVLDLGLRSRPVVQTGRLQAASASAMNVLISAVEDYQDGRSHLLADDHGQTFTAILLEEFNITTPVKRGRDFWCDYTIRYRQLP